MSAADRHCLHHRQLDQYPREQPARWQHRQLESYQRVRRQDSGPTQHRRRPNSRLRATLRYRYPPATGAAPEGRY